MTRADLVIFLAMAEQHIAEGDTRIARQRERIDGIERDGLDSTFQNEILATFLATQKLHTADRDRALAALAL